MEALGERTRDWLSRETGLPGSTIGDAIMGGIKTTERAIKIAVALGVSVDWLLTGRDRDRAHLADVKDADWVMLPRYDLRNLSEGGKGEPVEAVPYRRDWLNHRLLTSVGLWITELPSDYEALGLEEGDAIICSDIDANGPAEKWVCIFKGAAGPFVARYSNRGLVGEMDSPDAMFVTAVDLHGKDVFAVARIRARMLAKL